jgi:hypothetical protein
MSAREIRDRRHDVFHWVLQVRLPDCTIERVCEMAKSAADTLYPNEPVPAVDPVVEEPFYCTHDSFRAHPTLIFDLAKSRTICVYEMVNGERRVVMTLTRSMPPLEE